MVSADGLYKLIAWMCVVFLGVQWLRLTARTTPDIKIAVASLLCLTADALMSLFDHLTAKEESMARVLMFLLAALFTAHNIARDVEHIAPGYSKAIAAHHRKSGLISLDIVGPKDR